MPVGRLPSLTERVVDLVQTIEQARDRLGMHVCRSRIVGPARRKLGPPVTQAEFLRLDHTEQEVDQLRLLLMVICIGCPYGSCPMKRWPRATQPAP
jgi:hypothetical protein